MRHLHTIRQLHIRFNKSLHLPHFLFFFYFIFCFLTTEANNLKFKFKFLRFQSFQSSVCNYCYCYYSYSYLIMTCDNFHLQNVAKRYWLHGWLNIGSRYFRERQFFFLCYSHDNDYRDLVFCLVLVLAMGVFNNRRKRVKKFKKK